MSWIDEELKSCQFSDARLGKRLCRLMRQLSERMGNSVPTACQDWASTKAAYRFFSNPNLSEAEILLGHFGSTQSRFEQTDGPILVLHDTTEITYKRKDPAEVGYTRKCANRKGLFDQEKKRAQCGILMHSSLVLTPEGLPLGFSSKKFWNRDKFKGVKKIYRKQNATRIPIDQKESYRWLEGVHATNQLLGDAHRLVHIGDREADIYDLFHLAEQEDSQYLIRIKVDRRTEDETTTINQVLKRAKRRGQCRVTYHDKNGELVTATLEIKFEQITIKPAYGIKRKSYPDITATFIHAKEIGRSGTREPIDWKLITNLPIKTIADAVEKLHWYSLRWKIEIFFKILKSGCKIEESKLRTADALCKLIAIYSIVSWRVFWMTMLHRQGSHLPEELVLSELETKILDQLKPDRTLLKNNLSKYLLKIAKLGGYLARASDPPPGNAVMWRGMQRLTEIQIGVEIGMKLVGN
jgi:hypothetical protein